MLQTIYEVNIGSWFNMGWWRWSFCLIRQRMRFIESVNDRSAIENFPAMQIVWLEREKETAASQVHSKFDLDLPSYWTSVQKWNYRSKDFGTENCTRYEKFNEADPPSFGNCKNILQTIDRLFDKTFPTYKLLFIDDICFITLWEIFSISYWRKLRSTN